MNNAKAAKLAGIYAGIGFLWILFSDRFIFDLAGSPADVTSLQTLKGWAFVLCTALLAFWMARSALNRQTRLLESLARSEARWQFALDGAEQGVWDWSIQSGELFFSDRCKALLGYENGDLELTLHTGAALLHPDDIDHALADIQRHRNGDDGLLLSENRVRCKDGSYRWIQARGKVIEWDKGRRPLRMIGTFTDVTARRTAEAQLRLSASVFRFSRQGMVVTDVNADIVAVNPAFQDITGYREEDLIGQNPRVLRSGRHDRAFFEAMWRSIVQTGCWHGEIWNRRKNQEIYLEQLSISSVREKAGQGRVTHYIGIISDVTQIRRSEQALERLSFYDPLTELPNRTLLLSRLAHAVDCALRTRRSGAVLLLGIDHFKHINDSLGHDAGDALLRDIAQLLRLRMRQVDMIARLGGDEFVVVLEDLATPGDASCVAQYLIDILRQEFILADSSVHVGASIGISVFHVDGTTAEVLLQNAESALNNAKQERSSYCFYTPALTEAAKARLAMEEALRRGIERHEFLLYYQPLVHLSDGRIYGFEALLRWCPADGPMVMPDRFIPVAEHTGLIVPLGEWALGEACRQMADWLNAGYDLKYVAVNLSPRQFQDQALAEKTATILALTGLASHHLELEITEGAIMQQGKEALGILNRLKDLGVRLAIDDFGTGHSSLAYLTRFPIDKLKIDRSFVRDIPADRPNTEIVSTIIAMGRNLNLTVLAEGIETELQRSVLQQSGCEFGQGYLFSRPVPAAEAALLPGIRSGRDSD